MSKAKEKAAAPNEDYGPGFELQGVKVHDAINMFGKYTGYWSKEDLRGVELIYYPKMNAVWVHYNKEGASKTLLIPTANIPYMLIQETK